MVRKRELFAAAERALDPDAPLNPGDWCQFCRAAPVCPALAEQTREVIQADFAEVLEVEGEPSLPAPEALPDEVMLEVLEKRKMIEKWFDSIYQYMKGRALDGEQIPGYKLVPKRAIRRWTNEGKAESWAKEHGLGADDLFKVGFQSPYGIEQALKRAYPDPKERPDLPEDLVFEQSSGYNLVEEDHPKEAVNVVTAEEAFAGVLPPAETPDDEEAATEEEHDG